MVRILGTILVALGVLQTGLPQLGLTGELAQAITLAITVGIAALSFYLGQAPAVVAFLVRRRFGVGSTVGVAGTGTPTGRISLR